MLARDYIRRLALALVIVMAVVAIAIPTCVMVGCDMQMGGGMPFMPHGVGVFNDCPGQWVSSTGPLAVLSSSADTLMLTLLAAVVAAIVVFSPRMVARPVRVSRAEPPPPPEPPRGERFRV